MGRQRLVCRESPNKVYFYSVLDETCAFSPSFLLLVLVLLRICLFSPCFISFFFGRHSLSRYEEYESFLIDVLASSLNKEFFMTNDMILL